MNFEKRRKWLKSQACPVRRHRERGAQEGRCRCLVDLRNQREARRGEGHGLRGKVGGEGQG